MEGSDGATLDGDLNSEERGWAFEIAMGAELSRLPGNLHYWRENQKEVDYIYKFGKKLIAIEVQSGRKKRAAGLLAFQKHFPRSETLILTLDNYDEVLANLRAV